MQTILLWALVGLAAGWLASKVVASPHGIIVDLILGIVGALLGGFLYTLLDQRLGALASSSQVQDLPTIIRKPLSEPLFILGTLFILLVYFVPGGLAGVGNRVRGLRRSAGLEGTR